MTNWVDWWSQECAKYLLILLFARDLIFIQKAAIYQISPPLSHIIIVTRAIEYADHLLGCKSLAWTNTALMQTALESGFLLDNSSRMIPISCFMAFTYMFKFIKLVKSLCKIFRWIFDVFFRNVRTVIWEQSVGLVRSFEDTVKKHQSCTKRWCSEADIEQATKTSIKYLTYIMRHLNVINSLNLLVNTSKGNYKPRKL